MVAPLRRRLPLLLAALLVVACGDSPKDPEAPPGGGAAPPPPPPAARAVEWDPQLLAPREDEFIPLPGSGDTWISGTVVDGDGEPIPDAEVAMYALPLGEIPGVVPLLHASARAGKDGRFRVGPGPTPWRTRGLLTARAPGHARTALRAPAQVGPGEPFADEGDHAEIVLRPGLPVAGKVRTAEGEGPDGPVRIWALGGSSFQEWTETDAAGDFSLLAPPGEVWFLAVAGIHGPAQARLEVIEGGGNTVTVPVARGRDVRGRVVDLRTGEPVPGAVIRALYDRTRVLLADGEGRFALPAYWFRSFQVRAPGFAERQHVVGGSPGWVPGAEEVIHLAPGFVARGRVEDMDGRPVGDIRLRGFHPRPGGGLTDVAGPVSAADGSFTFVGIPLPEPEKEVRIFGMEPGWAYGPSSPLRAGPGEVVDGVRVVMPRLVTVRGSVRDEHGEPAGGMVRLSWPLEESLEEFRNFIPREARTTVGLDGRWEVEIPERTEFTVEAASEGYEGGTVAGRAPAHPDSVPDPSRRAPESPVVEVYRGLAIRGKVMDREGRPVTRGEVRVEPSPPNAPRNSRDARVRRDGTFEAGGFQPGLYDFSVLSAPEFLQEVVRGVRAGDPMVEVRLRRPCGVMGRIVLPPGAQEGVVAHLVIQGLEETLPLPSRREARVTPADRSFAVGPFAPGLYRVTITAGEWRYDREGLEVVTAPTDLGEIRLLRGGAVEGTVRIGGEPAPQAHIEVFQPLPGGAARTAGEAMTGPDGSFRVGGLAAGPHDLTVRPREQPFLRMPFVSEPGRTHRVDVAVPPGARVVVRVAGPDGKPAEGVRVLFSGPEGSVPYWKEGSPAPGPHETGPDGVLKAAGLPAGDLRVFAELAGIGSAEAAVSLEEGGRTTLDLRLEKRR